MKVHGNWTNSVSLYDDTVTGPSCEPVLRTVINTIFRQHNVRKTTKEVLGLLETHTQVSDTGKEILTQTRNLVT